MRSRRGWAARPAKAAAADRRAHGDGQQWLVGSRQWESVGRKIRADAAAVAGGAGRRRRRREEHDVGGWTGSTRIRRQAGNNCPRSDPRHKHPHTKIVPPV
ncbi:hypothetical protein [Oryza sativa Japonica Group]|uniref:Uncharacterized protein n=1 Tax=Oryza sativa subsp. japonica TaxID=39947 RepID=Q5NAK7_ORYSJ|nr:hypothetical protein [Oryza sativa Japonica Group]